MAENKTKATKGSVDAYFDGIADDQRRADCRAIAKLMTKVTEHKPKMYCSQGSGEALRVSLSRRLQGRG